MRLPMLTEVGDRLGEGTAFPNRIRRFGEEVDELPRARAVTLVPEAVQIEYPARWVRFDVEVDRMSIPGQVERSPQSGAGVRIVYQRRSIDEAR